MDTVPHCPHDVHAYIVHDDGGDTGKIDSEVQSRLHHHAVRRVEPAEKDRNKKQTDERRENREHDSQKKVCVYRAP